MNRILTLGRVLLVLAAVGALLLFSLWERSEDTTVPAQPPIIEAHAHAYLGWSGLWVGWFQDVFLSLTSKEDLPQVIDTRVFGGVELLKDPENRGSAKLLIWRPRRDSNPCVVFTRPGSLTKAL
jgi:hypothetical protein